jgi:hypothetical protein
MNDIADDKPYYTHTYEGDDDMLSLLKGHPINSYKAR